VSYVDAGYAIALGALLLYGASLVVRRRRLSRALAVADKDRRASASHGGTPPGPGGRP